MESTSLPTHIQSLLAELPDCVILPADAPTFHEAVNSSWAQQNREITPACIVRPRHAQHLGHAIRVLKREYDLRQKANASLADLFAVRSGGSNPSLGAGTVKDGVVIDLALIRDIEVDVGNATVTIGAGAKWGDVYKTLEVKGLTVVGGRNSPVGVGGLALQGGISFYSPRFGFVCSNVVSYEVVLADGTVVTASATEHPDLWRVLKGGSSNFGIVTHFTLRSIPSAPIWTMQVAMPAMFQTAKGLRAFHDYVKGASHPSGFDENAAGPILSFLHMRGLPMQIMALHLAYTKAPDNGKWPEHWKESSFASLWGLYRSTNVQSHAGAVEQLGRTSPAGTRHVMGTKTIRNDLETIRIAYEMFSEAATKLRSVKGLMFPFIYQAILPGWINKGDPNVLGGASCKDPLVIISCSVSWSDAKDDDLVRSTVHGFLQQIEAAAAARQAGHRFVFGNYCMEFQSPYSGLDDEEVRRMREASRTYDPDGLFQSGLSGGFKLEGLPPVQEQS